MYGTVMIARLKNAAAGEELRDSLNNWREERPDRPGFVDTRLLLTEDGSQVVSAVRFQSKEQYEAMADDPGQHEWYTTQLLPRLDGEPTWIDGNWFE
jgi:heme-degrading monooxygenase HmoA